MDYTNDKLFTFLHYNNPYFLLMSWGSRKNYHEFLLIGDVHFLVGLSQDHITFPILIFSEVMVGKYSDVIPLKAHTVDVPTVIL